MVDHDMDLVLDVCDRIVVLNLGKVIAVGPPAEIERNDEVKRAYLGTPHPDRGTAPGLPPTPRPGGSDNAKVTR